MSAPGTPQQKDVFYNCVSCHNLDRIVRSQYDADQFMDVFNRMVGYYQGSTPEHPQRLVGNAQRQLGWDAARTELGTPAHALLKKPTMQELQEKMQP